MRVIYADSSVFSAFNMIRALRRNEILAIQIDRGNGAPDRRTDRFFGVPPLCSRRGRFTSRGCPAPRCAGVYAAPRAPPLCRSCFGEPRWVSREIPRRHPNALSARPWRSGGHDPRASRAVVPVRAFLAAGAMKIYLISPSHYNPDGSIHKTTRYWTSGTTLPYLKRLTPPEHEVTMVDELFYDVDLDSDADVVGLTAMGPQIARAYDLADHFRARGKKVVLGGTWVTLTAEESLQARRRRRRRRGRARLVDRARRSRGRRARRASTAQPSGTRCATCRRSIIGSCRCSSGRRSRRVWLYRMYFHWPIVFSRGCPHPCEYCAVQTYYRRSYRTRPIDDVLADIEQIRSLGGDRLLSWTTIRSREPRMPSSSSAR